VSFAVPTGNFGDVFAGWVAARMGLPVARLLVATNSNDILARALASGQYRTREVVPTTSPSMDIQVSSNFERLLFEAAGRDAAAVRAAMGSLAQSGAFEVAAPALAAKRAEFDAARVDEAEAAATMRALRRDSGYLADPHTAVAVAASRKMAGDPAVPRVVLATAHPAKFPGAVEAATGERPALPPHLADLFEQAERMSVVANDLAEVEKFVAERSRAAREAA
jgi:threonine synthase